MTLLEKLQVVKAKIDEEHLGYDVEIDEPEKTVLVKMVCEKKKTMPVVRAVVGSSAADSIATMRVSRRGLEIVLS
jgi:hypothetical protein